MAFPLIPVIAVMGGGAVVLNEIQETFRASGDAADRAAPALVVAGGLGIAAAAIYMIVKARE